MDYEPYRIYFYSLIKTYSEYLLLYAFLLSKDIRTLNKEFRMTTYSAIFYHLIWSTKNREPLINEIIENSLYRYISGIIYGKKGLAIQIGGMADHIHILLKTGPDNNISQIVKEVKVSSTKWVRQSFQKTQGFSWQEGYGVFSVSKSNIHIVQKYIQNQKEHHRVSSFEKELIGLIERHEIEYDPKYAFS